MSFSRTVCLIIITTLVGFLSGSGVHAFGAGNIPSCVGSVIQKDMQYSWDVCVRFAYMEGRAFRHGDIVCVSSQTEESSYHAPNSQCRKTHCPNWLRRLVYLLSVHLLGKGVQSLVGWISNAYTLGPHTYLLAFKKAHTFSRNWLRDYSQVCCIQSTNEYSTYWCL